LPPSERFRELSSSLERCLGCGLCELAGGATAELHDLARSLWRTPVAWPALGQVIDSVSEEELRTAEESCPVSVPFPEMVSLLREMAAHDLAR